MDDTALQAPRRPRSRRAEPRALGEVFPPVPDHQRVDIEVDCGTDGCGTRVRLKTPERAPAIAVHIIHKQSRGEVPVFCDSCLAEIEERDYREEVAATRAQVVGDRIRSSGIPRRWLEETWAGVERDADRAPALRAVEGWAGRAKGAPRAVLLHGEVGRGKSHIAGVAALERCRVSRVKWLNMAELMFDLSRSMSDPKRTAAMDALDPGRYDTGVALVLDDLDKVRPTDFGVQPVYLAVNAWVEARQPLLVTMNWDLERLEDEFGERYGAAIASRLAGYCSVFEVAGRDRRVDP